MMNKNQTHEIDENNILFIQHELAQSGLNGLKIWYDQQPNSRQEYFLQVLDEYVLQLSEFRQTLSSNTTDAEKVLAKFMNKCK